MATREAQAAVKILGRSVPVGLDQWIASKVKTTFGKDSRTTG
jgi:hypothetical protein